MTEITTSDVPGISDAESTAGSLHDIYVRQNWQGFVGLILLCTVISLVCLLGGSLLSIWGLLLIPVLAIIGVCTALLLSRRQVRANVARIVSDYAEDPVDIALNKALGEHGRLDVNLHLACLAQALAKTIHTGSTVRVCPPRFRDDLEPITVEFEARPLSGRVTRFDDLNQATVSRSERKEFNPGQHAVRRGRLSGRARRWFAVGGRIANALCVLLIVIIVARRCLIERDVWSPIVYMAIAAIIALGATLGSAWSFRRQWLVAPGGVILRESSFFRREWNLHIFDRRKSVLIAHRMNGNQWVVFVADREMQRQATITENEAEFLLRAWLSPLRPPAVERLSDLA